MSMLYNRQNPFLATVKERYSLCKKGSKKNTQHLVLDLKGSGLIYEVGDCIGLFPQHDAELVARTLQAMQATGQEKICPKPEEDALLLVDYLTKRANITEISPKLFKEVAARQTNLEKKEHLESLLQEENWEIYKTYVSQHEVWDFLLAHSEVNFKSEEWGSLLKPLLPRFYSIASSQKYVGEEVHLTIAPVEYETSGYQRRGVCTHYLCQLVELHQPCVPIFIQTSHNFRLPEDPHVPLIMVGPGTGIAPFRAFLQERFLHSQSQGQHWLFFGEWNQDYDFFYQEEWEYFKTRGNLRLEIAFSRDQTHKVYVQHKMYEQGREFYDWLENGAYLYICGDARSMAKDVDAALHQLLQEHGNKHPTEAKDYVKRLRQQKRYLRDVY